MNKYEEKKESHQQVESRVWRDLKGRERVCGTVTSAEVEGPRLLSTVLGD